MSESPRRLAAFCFAVLTAATGLTQESSDTQSQTEDLPSLSELEARGVTIGRVNFDMQNVFDTTQEGEDKRLYRWANRVHLVTRQRIVEDILLFEQGDALVQPAIEESARLLRSQRFIADAAIFASNFDPIANTADIEIQTRDAWSLEPDLKLSRSGGENEYGIGLVEDNLFGLGKSLTMSYSSDVDRDQRLFSYTDNNVAGSRKQVSATYADLSDGRQFRLRAGRPFYSLDTRWSVTGESIDDQRVDSIYELGEVIEEFRHDTRFMTVSGGRSQGLIDGMARRWLAGITYEEDEFQLAPGFGSPVLLPDDRRLIYPWVGVQWIGDDYREVTELNDMGRTEDISLGLNVFARLGIASPALDSDRRSYLFDLTAARGWEPGGPGRLMLFESSATTRYEYGEFRNTIVALSGRYTRRILGDELFLASLTTVLGNRLDAENQILLGGDNNLRGYPLRYQSGEHSAVLNIEQRFYTDWYPFRLIRVGYAFFLDVGRVWGEDIRQTEQLGTLYDVGVGLRLTSPRSSGRSVVHIDLAVPINAPDDIDGLQIVIEKKATF